MHGARGGAPALNTNARKHGRFSCEVVDLRKMLVRLTREGRKLAEEIK